MCYSSYGLPQGDYKRCVIPARDSLKGITYDVLLLLGTPSNRITNDVLFLLGTPSRGLQTMCYSCYRLPQGDYK